MFKNKGSRIYITDAGRQALNNSSMTRKMAETEKELYDILKNDYRELNLLGALGQDRIVYTVERKLGKTTAIIDLAEELGLPIVAQGVHKQIIEDEVKKAGIKDKVKVMDLTEIERRDGKSIVGIHTVLIDEGTELREIRSKLHGYGYDGINIIGIQ